MGKPQLTASDVATIRKQLTDDNLKALAEQFDVHPMTVRNAAMGLNFYSRYTDPPPLAEWVTQKKHRKSMFTAEDREEIKRLRNAGKSNRSLAKEYGCSESYISQIVHGRWDD